MATNDLKPKAEDQEANHLQAIGAKIDFCMQRYRPYLRKDFNMHHLSVITNFKVLEIEFFFTRHTPSFDEYIDEWRIKHAKNLINMKSALSLEIKTIGSLSGFSSTNKFYETFKNIEGISPEMYQSHINKNK